MCELRGIDDALPRSNRAPDIGEGHVRRTGWGGDHGAFGTVNQLETADEVSRSGLTVALAVFALAIVQPAPRHVCIEERGHLSGEECCLGPGLPIFDDGRQVCVRLPRTAT